MIRFSVVTAIVGFASASYADPTPAPQAIVALPAANHFLATSPAGFSGAQPDGTRIISFRANGTGCPPGSVSYQLVGSTLSVTYSRFTAQAGDGAHPTDWRKNCILQVGVHVPSGFTYSFFSVDHSGYMQLDPGVVGKQSTQYYFAGQLGRPMAESVAVGPFDGPFFRRDTIDTMTAVWAPCGADSIASINEAVSVNNSNAPRRADYSAAGGTISNDETDITSTQVYNYNLTWKQCR